MMPSLIQVTIMEDNDCSPAATSHHISHQSRRVSACETWVIFVQAAVLTGVGCSIVLCAKTKLILFNTKIYYIPSSCLCELYKCISSQ